MNIAVDIRALGNKKLTGIGKYIFYALENILSIDQENTYYLISTGLKKSTYSHLPFKQSNVKHIHLNIPNKILNTILITGVGSQLVHKFFRNIDIFWMPNINFYLSGNDTPMILTIHDLSFLHDREFYSIRRRYWHKLVDVGFLVRKSRAIVAVSANTKRDIVRFFSIDKDKIHIINPGVHIVKMDKTKAQSLIDKYHLPEKYFIYVGTLEPRKNIGSIIKAFDRYHRDYPETALVIVGGRGWVYRRLIKQIKKRDYVRYLDYVDSPVKDALYFLSQGLIWPSFYEGFGFPPMEAMSLGIPLIVSYKTSLPETMKRYPVYVDPYNISDIYQAMLQITTDQNLQKQFKVYPIPNWQDQAKQLIALFNQYKK